MPSALTSARCVFRRNYLNGIRSNMTTRTATRTTSSRLRASSQQTEGTGTGTRGGVALEGLRWNNKFAVRRRRREVDGEPTGKYTHSLTRCSFIHHHPNQETLPADPDTSNRTRQVENAIFTRVDPTPTGTEPTFIIGSSFPTA